MLLLPTLEVLALTTSSLTPKAHLHNFSPSRRNVLAAAAAFTSSAVFTPPAANAATGAAVDLVVQVGDLSTQARILQFYVRDQVTSSRADYGPLRKRVMRDRAGLQQLLVDMSAAAPDLRICAPELADCDCTPDPKRMARATQQVEFVRTQLDALDAALADPRGFDELESGQGSYVGGGVERALEEICEAADTFLDLAAGRPLMTERLGLIGDSSARAPVALAGRAAAASRRAAVPMLSASSPTVSHSQPRRATAVMMRAAPPECVDKLDRGLLRACALSWLAVAAPMLGDPSSVTLDVFGLDVSGGYGVQQPAAGFLQLAATLVPLEAALLLALASDALDARQTRARVSAAVVLAGAGVVATCAAAAATGLSIEQPAAVLGVLSLSAVSAASVARPLLREISPSELTQIYADDARTLVRGDGDSDGGALPSFYRSSAIASIVVGGAFMLSPISPLAVYEAELPVTYLARAAFGVYIALLLAPVQFALYRAADERRLTEPTGRLLNLICAASIVLLDGCGNAQVRAQEVLVAGVDGLPDTFRFETNTTAAFYTALLVAIVYLVQGLREQETA